jgi:hypothetical protein
MLLQEYFESVEKLVVGAALLDFTWTIKSASSGYVAKALVSFG